MAGRTFVMGGDQYTKQLFKGAFLLSMAGLLGKIISAGYRIPLQNLTGDLGFYIYQQIYPFIGISLMLALYGFPAAISKLKAEQSAEGKSLSFHSFYGPVLFLLWGTNSLFFLFLFTQAGLLAMWMGDPLLEESLQMAAFVFLMIPFTSLLRGSFQGNGQMAPTAASQIMEQLVRVVFILGIAVYVDVQEDSYYLIGRAAAAGAVAGMAVAFFYLLSKWKQGNDWEKTRTDFPWIKNFRAVFVFGLFLCSVQMTLLFIQFADTFTLVPALIDYGISFEEARLWKGVLDRGQPLIQLGTVLGSSLALALIPSITNARWKDNPARFRKHVHSAWKISFVISSGAAAGLILIFPYANLLLFQDMAGTISLRILMFAVLVTSLLITSASFLQGLGYIYQPGIFVGIGIVTKFLLNALLVPVLGLAGGAIATVVSLLLILGLNLSKLKSGTIGLPLPLLPGKAWFASIAAMAVWIIFLQYGLLGMWEITTRLSCLFYVLFVSASGGGIYLGLFIRWNGFTTEELQALPGDKYLTSFLKRRKSEHE